MNIRGQQLSQEQIDCFNRLLDSSGTAGSATTNKVPAVSTDNVKDACDQGNAAYSNKPPKTLDECQQIVDTCLADPNSTKSGKKKGKGY